MLHHLVRQPNYKQNVSTAIATNLFQNEKGSGVVKLTDFGLSRMVDLEELMKTKLFTR